MYTSGIELVPREDYAMWANLLCICAGVGEVLGIGLMDQLSKAGLTGDGVM